MTLPSIPGVTIRDAVVNIIGSVALEEYGLSHIINGEGEIIQAAEESLALFTDTATTIALQESVNDILKTIAKLHMLLQFKLENAEDILNLV